MNKLIIIRGVSGSGKTTFAQKLIDEKKADVFFEADQYFMRPDGVYDFNFRTLPNAHKWCFENVEQAIVRFSTCNRVVVSNTFTRLWEMQGYLDLAKKLGVEVEVYRCVGNFENTHGVPADKVQAMKDRFEDFAGEILVNN